jgi:NADH-quinone oxidoreductase subunit A
MPDAVVAALIWPLAVYFVAVVVVVALMVAASWFLGERRRDLATGQPYESGILPTGSARLRISAKFYLIAMFFVIFDLEAAFIFAWAVSLREVGWAGYIGMVSFIAALVVALIYLWRQGALDWGSTRRKVV